LAFIIRFLETRIEADEIKKLINNENSEVNSLLKYNIQIVTRFSDSSGFFVR
jgi:hypothetical protein